MPSLYIGANFEGDTKKPFLANSRVRVSYRLRSCDTEKGKIKSGHFVHKVLNMENTVVLSTLLKLHDGVLQSHEILHILRHASNMLC